MESRALLVAIALLGLAGCQAFGEEPGEPQEQNLSQPPPAPATTDSAPTKPAPVQTGSVEEPAPPPLAPPLPGERAWSGKAKQTGTDEYDSSFPGCTHTVEMKEVVVNITIGVDGAPVSARVDSSFTDRSCSLTSGLIALPTPQVFTKKSWAAQPDGTQRIELAMSNDTKTTLHIDGRFDQGDQTQVKLRWVHSDPSWTIDAKVDVTATAP